MMIQPDSIDLKRSIESGWLKARFPVGRLIFSFFINGAVGFFVLASLLMLCLFIYEGYTDWKACVLLLLICSTGSFYIYRVITETRLLKVSSSLTADKIHSTLVQHYESTNEHILHSSKDKMLTFSPEAFALSNTDYGNYTVLLIEHGAIYLCMYRNSRKRHYPVLFSHYILARHLRSLLK